MIVCDTNVLLSALLFPGGPSDKILRGILSGRLEHATSPDILTEVRRVLEKKFGLEKGKAEEAVQLLVRASRLVYPTERLSVVREDEPDNRILECAITAKASHLVTGDKKHLLPLRSFQGIEIITPRGFCEISGIV